MSSSYHVMCLSHDPATYAVGDFNNRREALEAIADGVHSHPACDLLIMRMSGAPVEFTCTGQTEACKHSYAQDADADWLRILAYFHPTEDVDYLNGVRSSPTLKHWTPQRLQRLAAHL